MMEDEEGRSEGKAHTYIASDLISTEKVCDGQLQ